MLFPRLTPTLPLGSWICLHLSLVVRHSPNSTMSIAYQQVPLTEEAQKYTTVNIHKGLFQYLRLPFGITSAPGIFQDTMETILQDLPYVCVYLNDIIVTGPGGSTPPPIQTLLELARSAPSCFLPLSAWGTASLQMACNPLTAKLEL